MTDEIETITKKFLQGKWFHDNIHYAINATINYRLRGIAEKKLTKVRDEQVDYAYLHYTREIATFENGY